MKTILIGLSLGLMLWSVSPSFLVANSAEEAVKARQDIMKQYGKSMKTMAGMMRGKIAYDADGMAKAAAIIRDHSGDAFLKHFPQNSIVGTSESLPIIWQEWDEFADLSTKAGIYANGLVKAASNPMSDDAMGEISMLDEAEKQDADRLGGMGPNIAFSLMAGTCKACHSKFREKHDH